MQAEKKEKSCVNPATGSIKKFKTIFSGKC
jgi:hypothetical protein